MLVMLVMTKIPSPPVFVARTINNAVIKASVSTLTLSTGPTDGFYIRQPQRWRLRLWTVPGRVQVERRQVGHNVIQGFTELSFAPGG